MANAPLDIGVALKVSIVKYACAVMLVTHILLYDSKKVVHQERRQLWRGEVAMCRIKGQGIEGEVSYRSKLPEDHVSIGQEATRQPIVWIRQTTIKTIDVNSKSIRYSLDAIKDVVLLQIRSMLLQAASK
jgi:hypothetical protein